MTAAMEMERVLEGPSISSVLSDRVALFSQGDVVVVGDGAGGGQGAAGDKGEESSVEVDGGAGEAGGVGGSEGDLVDVDGGELVWGVEADLSAGVLGSGRWITEIDDT